MQKTRRSCAPRTLALCAMCCLCALAVRAQANPVPLINQPLVPDAVAPGGQAFTLTVNGTGFVSGATVNWNGSPRATTFVSASQLAASIGAADIAAAGTAAVTVTNPNSEASNAVFLPVAAPISLLAFSRADYAPPGAPSAAVAGDFNGDGRLDFAVTTTTGLSVYLGNGDGTFQAPVSYAYASTAGVLVAADFNGDGKVDLAFTIGFPSTPMVAVSLGNGDGTFQPPLEASVSGLGGMAVGDFNGDGNLDLAIATEPTGVSVLLGNGDGTFQTPVQYTTPENAFSVATGDFNGDGKLDLAVTINGQSQVSVLLGNGDGTFQSPVGYAAGVGPSAITAADLNGDGKLDLVVGDLQGRAIKVLLGNGDGTFKKPLSNPAAYPQTVAVADFNGDGKVDVAASTEANAVNVFLGNGDGTFQKAVRFSTATLPEGLAVADFNNDGRLDVAAAGFEGSAVSILLQTQGPVVSLSAATLTFGVQALGTRSPAQTVKLTNTGATDLDITSLAASANFVQTNTCGSVVHAAATCSINIAFKPLMKGPLTGSVTITDNAAGSPQVISLTGTGTLAQLTPTSIAFGSVPSGTSVSQKVTLTNVSTTTSLTIFNITFSTGPYTQSNNCGSSLAAKASCTITVTFTPPSPGTYNSTLQVADSGGGSPQTVSLTGTGT